MKALVLNSGGVDSTTCVAMAIAKFGKNNVSTVSVYYGQKHKKELNCAEKIANHYGVKHYVLNLCEVMRYSNCSLLENSTEEIKCKSYEEQIQESKDGIVNSYVPFRNGLMLSSVAALAMSIYPEEKVEIYLGVHADDAAGNAYADCSEAFTQAIGEAIKIRTYEKISVVAPLVLLNKAEVVSIGLQLKAPYELTTSCYNGKEKACGKCATCIDRLKAFEANKATDPINYEIELN